MRYIYFLRRIFLSYFYVPLFILIISLLTYHIALHINYFAPQDFCQNYYAAKYFIQHLSIYTRLPCGVLQYNAYPPSATLFFLPFALLSIRSATVLYILITVLCYFTAGILLLKELKLLSVFSFAVFMLGSIFWPSLQNANNKNNVINIILIVLVIVFIVKRKNHPYVSGILLGVISLIKVWPILLLIGAFLTGQKRVAISGVITLVVGVILSLLFFTSNAYVTYFGPVYNYEKSWAHNPGNISLTGTMIKLFIGYYDRAKPILFSLPEPTVIAISYFMSVAVILLTFVFVYWYSKHTKGRQQDFLPEALLISISLLVFPLTWDWNQIILLVPSVYLLQKLRLHPKQPFWWYGIVLIGIIGMINPGYIHKYWYSLSRNNDLFLTISTIFFIAALVIFGLRTRKRMV